MNTVYAGCCGVLLAGGLWMLLRGLRRTVAADPVPWQQRWASLTRRPRGRRGRRRDQMLVVGVVAGVLGYLVTGWLLMVPLGPVLLLGIPYLLGEPPQHDVELLSALDRWVRTLAATLPTGQSIADAIRGSVRTAPPLLQGEVRTLVGQLDQRTSTREALLATADRLDSPDADAVLAALALAAHRGGTGATATLQALSESITDRLRARRDIEAERAKPRVVVRQVTVISAVVLGASLLAGGQYFEPYRSGIGQLLLAALVAVYLGSLLAMRRVTRPPRRQRILHRVRELS